MTPMTPDSSSEALDGGGDGVGVGWISNVHDKWESVVLAETIKKSLLCGLAPGHF